MCIVHAMATPHRCTILFVSIVQCQTRMGIIYGTSFPRGELMLPTVLKNIEIAYIMNYKYLGRMGVIKKKVSASGVYISS